MLDSLRGTLVRAEVDFAVVDVNGLMFRADIPTSTYSQLGGEGSEVTLRVRLKLNMNEGTFDLFGFATDTERECFEILTGMTGIGPRKALMILSQIEIAAFARAITTGDLKYLAKVKGVGQKTAERLIVELREKMAPYSQAPAGAAGVAAPSLTALPQKENVREAVEALLVLGCRPAVAEKAVSEAVKVVGEDTPTEELVRAALKFR